MIPLLLVIIVVLSLQLTFAVWNASRLPKLGALEECEGSFEGAAQSDVKEAVRPDVPPPFAGQLSILIPARDEARNIEACLASVLRAAGSTDCEILVLDDRSTDGTGQLAASTGDSRVRVLSGRELPTGWVGKSHACAQLAEAADGEWLLFLDADVRLVPGALEAASRSACQQKRGLITGFPRQLVHTWLERLVVPLMGFTIICHLPIPLVRKSRDPRFAAAHGGFLLIHRDTYLACGGHTTIRSELLDDMSLIRAVKAEGEPASLMDITAAAEMRMYQSAGEVWRGYRKNLYAGLGRNPYLLFGMMGFYLLLYVMPFATLLLLLLVSSTLEPGWTLTGLAILAWLLGVFVKRVSDRSGRQPIWLCLLQPFSILALTGIALASWRGSRSRAGYEWKGRRYS